MTELSLVKGINARQIKLLSENGISTAEALAMTGALNVAAIDGLGDKTAQKLIWNARNALGMTEFISASEIDENIEYITTGSAELDRILGGGIATGKLTEVYGPFKSGKTNLAHTIAVTTQLPTSQGGIDGAVAFIDTENTFSKDKIERIAKRFGFRPKKVLSRLFHARIYSSDHQQQMIQKAEILCKSRNVRLIIVDSLMALMRAEFVGIGLLAKRQGLLNNMIHGLSRIAETYNCAILLTNQVATKMMGMYSADDAIGGNIVAHGCHFRIMFKTKGFSSNNSLKRRAIIVDAPDLPPEECEFFITSAGVADTEKVEFKEGLEDIDMIFEPVGIDKEEQEDMKKVTTKSIEHKHPPQEDNLTLVKGLGASSAKTLKKEGINTLKKLVMIDPEALAKKISGLSPSKIMQWQKAAKLLI
ncbi:MAG: DNA repair and recombination protein RadA [Promethearchaeota archaeon]